MDWRKSVLSLPTSTTLITAGMFTVVGVLVGVGKTVSRGRLKIIAPLHHVTWSQPLHWVTVNRHDAVRDVIGDFVAVVVILSTHRN